MHIGEIRIVDGQVRIYDVDGSYLDESIKYILDIYEWAAKHRHRLLEELRLQAQARTKHQQRQ